MKAHNPYLLNTRAFWIILIFLSTLYATWYALWYAHSLCLFKLQFSHSPSLEQVCLYIVPLYIQYPGNLGAFILDSMYQPFKSTVMLLITWQFNCFSLLPLFPPSDIPKRQRPDSQWKVRISPLKPSETLLLKLPSWHFGVTRWTF